MTYYEQLDAEEVKRLIEKEGWDYEDFTIRNQRIYDELMEQEIFDSSEEIALAEQDIKDDLQKGFDTLDGLIKIIHN